MAPRLPLPSRFCLVSVVPRGHETVQDSGAPSGEAWATCTTPRSQNMPRDKHLSVNVHVVCLSVMTASHTDLCGPRAFARARPLPELYLFAAGSFSPQPTNHKSTFDTYARR